MTKVQGNGGAISLDEMLDLLHSPDGADLVEAIRDDVLAANGGKITDVPDSAPPYELPVLPDAPDRFERTELELLAHKFTAQGTGYNVPRATVATFAQIADENGWVDLDRIESTLGPQAKAFALQIKERIDARGGTVPTARRKLKYARLPADLRVQIARSAPHETYRERMPVLDDLRRVFDGRSLDGWDYATVLHLFSHSRALMDELAHYGVKKESSRIIGKYYSTDPDAFARLEGDGWNVDPRSVDTQINIHETLPLGKPARIEGGPALGLLNEDEARLRTQAREQLQAMFADIDDPAAIQEPRFILADEGGFLLDVLHREMPEYAHLCVALEQTEKGMLRVDSLRAEGVEPKCPIVDLARCDLKKLIGGPVFGEACVFATEQALDEMSPELKLDPKEAVVIGYGSMGKGYIDGLLRRGFKREDIYVYDIDPAQMKAAKEAGHPVGSLPAILEHGHLLVSGTGDTGIRPDQYDLLPDGAFLVNIGSGRNELVPEGNTLNGTEYDPCDRIWDGEVSDDFIARSTFRGKEIVTTTEPGDEFMPHEKVRTPSGKELMLLRRGYVINMKLGTPPEFVQLLFGGIIAGVFQATDLREPGVVDLDAEMQQFITSRLRTNLQRAKLSIDKPDYRKVDGWFG